MAEKGYCKLDQHLGTGNGRLGGLTPDRARALACSTVLMAGRRREVLNGREGGLGNCLLPGQGFGRHTAGSRR